MSKLNKIQELTRRKAELNARIALFPYDGTPEIKENKSGKYIYIRKRILGKLTSTYVDKYSEDLYLVLLKNAKERREINKELRQIEKQLAELGYFENELSKEVILNLDFARANLKSNIYNQAILEGVATTFPQTETIIENGQVNDMLVSDVEKILNLKHAWEFILDKDIIMYPSDFNVLSYIAKLVNEGFYLDGGKVRTLPVAIGGSTYVPPIPNEDKIKEDLKNIIDSDSSILDKAIELLLYTMKSQIFIDGNKRVAVIFANHYLISKGKGLLVIPYNLVPEFKRLLVNYYESNDEGKIRDFLEKLCYIH